VAAGNALKEDSIVGDALQIIVTAEGAECFVHPHGERPQSHADLELVTVEYQPWINVYQHSHFPEFAPAVSRKPPSSMGPTPIRPESALHGGKPHADGEHPAITRFCVGSSKNDGCTKVGAENSADPEGFRTSRMRDFSRHGDRFRASRSLRVSLPLAK
jgi:hypothetical protein